MCKCIRGCDEMSCGLPDCDECDADQPLGSPRNPGPGGNQDGKK